MLRKALFLGNAWFLVFIGFALSGCGGSTKVSFQPGRIYVIDNTRPPPSYSPEACIVRTWIEYDGQFYYLESGLPRNMNFDGTCNYLDPVQLTEEPLPGGTRVTVTYWFDHQNSTIEHRDITFTIDGDITVELYMASWLHAHNSMVYARIHKGKWTGPDPAAGPDIDWSY